MLNWLVGNVDVPAAAVLIAAFIGLSVFGTTWMANHQSAQARDQQFELSKMKQRDDHALLIYQEDRAKDKMLAELTSKREIEFARIEHGLVTSHTSQTEQG